MKNRHIIAAKCLCEPIRCQTLLNAHTLTHEINPGIKRFLYQILDAVKDLRKVLPTHRIQGRSSNRRAFNWSLRDHSDRMQCSDFQNRGLNFTSVHTLAAHIKRLPSRTPDTLRSILTPSQDHCFLVTQPNAGL